MKKQLLTLSLLIMSIGLFSQSTIWMPKNSNLDTSWGIRYLSVVDSSVVWAVGYNGSHPTATTNRFTRTVNGSTFAAGTFFPDTLYYSPSNISAVSDSIAFVSAWSLDASRNGVIMKTTDGGTTWMNVADTVGGMFNGGANFPDVVHFWNKNNGWALGDPNGNTGGGATQEYEIYQSSNGGTTWTRVPDANIPNPSSGEAGLTDVYTTYGSKFIWFGTTAGRVYHSKDGGSNWTVANPAGMAAGAQGLAFRDSLNGLVWGRASSGGALVLKRTFDGGSTWSAVPTNTLSIGTFDFAAVPGRGTFISVGINGTGASTGGGGTAYVTSITGDDGNTWTVLESGVTNAERMLAIQMVDSMHGWAGSFSDNTLPLGLGGMNKFIGTSIPVTCPMHVVSGVSTICSGNTALLTASGTTNYTWTPGSATTNTISVSPTNTTTYTVNGATGTCTNTASFVLTVNATPTVAVTSSVTNDTICALNSAQLTATGGTTYSWLPVGSFTGSGSSVATSYTLAAGNHTYTVTGTTGSCSSTNTITITVLPCTGVNQLSVNGTQVSFYPNPSNGSITVSLSNVKAGTALTVSDMLGNEVYKTSMNANALNQNINIDLSSLPKGVYLFGVSNGSQARVQKLVIQ